jgi:uncharacterized membrane protein
MLIEFGLITTGVVIIIVSILGIIYIIKKSCKKNVYKFTP